MATNTLLLRVTPAPRNLIQSRAIFQRLNNEFGEISMYKHLRHEATTLQLTSEALVIFKHPENGMKALQAKKMSIDVPTIQNPSNPPIDSPNASESQPATPSRQSLAIEITTSAFNHLKKIEADLFRAATRSHPTTTDQFPPGVSLAFPPEITAITGDKLDKKVGNATFGGWTSWRNEMQIGGVADWDKIPAIADAGVLSDIPSSKTVSAGWGVDKLLADKQEKSSRSATRESKDAAVGKAVKNPTPLPQPAPLFQDRAGAIGGRVLNSRSFQNNGQRYHDRQPSNSANNDNNNNNINNNINNNNNQGIRRRNQQEPRQPRQPSTMNARNGSSTAYVRLGLPLNTLRYSPGSDEIRLNLNRPDTNSANEIRQAPKGSAPPATTHAQAQQPQAIPKNSGASQFQSPEQKPIDESRNVQDSTTSQARSLSQRSDVRRPEELDNATVKRAAPRLEAVQKKDDDATKPVEAQQLEYITGVRDQVYQGSSLEEKPKSGPTNVQGPPQWQPPVQKPTNGSNDAQASTQRQAPDPSRPSDTHSSARLDDGATKPLPKTINNDPSSAKLAKPETKTNLQEKPQDASDPSDSSVTTASTVAESSKEALPTSGGKELLEAEPPAVAEQMAKPPSTQKIQDTPPSTEIAQAATPSPQVVPTTPLATQSSPAPSPLIQREPAAALPNGQSRLDARKELRQRAIERSGKHLPEQETQGSWWKFWS